MNKTEILQPRFLFGVALAGGGFGLLSEAARDSTGGAFRTIGMVVGAILLVAGLAVAGPVLKALGQKKRSEPAEPRSSSHTGVGLVAAALILPVLAGTALFFVTSFALALGISAATVIASAALVAMDARRLGNVDQTGRVRESAGLLFVGMVLLWIVVYPLAFFRRRHFGGPNLAISAVVVAVFFAVGPVLYSVLVPPGLPSCTSPEVVRLLDQVIRGTPAGASAKTIDGHQELSYDRDADVRHGQCVVHTDTGDINVKYLVEWLDRDNGL